MSIRISYTITDRPEALSGREEQLAVGNTLVPDLGGAAAYLTHLGQTLLTSYEYRLAQQGFVAQATTESVRVGMNLAGDLVDSRNEVQALQAKVAEYEERWARQAKEIERLQIKSGERQPRGDG